MNLYWQNILGVTDQSKEDGEVTEWESVGAMTLNVHFRCPLRQTLLLEEYVTA